MQLGVKEAMGQGGRTAGGKEGLKGMKEGGKEGVMKGVRRSDKGRW